MIRVTQNFTKDKEQVNTVLEVEGGQSIKKQRFLSTNDYIDRNIAITRIKSKAYKTFHDAYLEIKNTISDEYEFTIEDGKLFYQHKFSSDVTSIFNSNVLINEPFMIGLEGDVQQAVIDTTEEIYSILYKLDDIIDLLID